MFVVRYLGFSIGNSVRQSNLSNIYTYWLDSIGFLSDILPNSRESSRRHLMWSTCSTMSRFECPYCLNFRFYLIIANLFVLLLVCLYVLAERTQISSPFLLFFFSHCYQLKHCLLFSPPDLNLSLAGCHLISPSLSHSLWDKYAVFCFPLFFLL